MRFDDRGLFWQDLPISRKCGAVVRTQPPIPDTGWKAPRDFPSLSSALTLSVDVETYDPELLDNGPGWARNKGHIVGVSIGADSGGRWYFPVRHEIEPEDNLNPDKVFAWLKDVLANPRQPKVGANLLYDIGWLGEEGVIVNGDLYDVQFAEALLTERGKVALDHLGFKYLGEHKDSSLLYQWCSDFYGGPATDKQRANIYRTPPRLTGPYAESDADLPLHIIPKQYALLREQKLDRLFLRENKLIPLLIAMRRKGVSIDIPKAEHLHERLTIEVEKQRGVLRTLAKRDIDTNSSASLARAFDGLGLAYKKTAKGNPSFTKGFLKDSNHAVAKKIVEVRKLEKIKNTFIKSYLLDSHVNGKIFCQFHLLRNDNYGARGGRFSSSNPNLQNITARDELWAPLIRGLFRPDAGHKQWRKMDASQIEYRFLAHFAVGEGSDEIRAMYNSDPTTDYHVLAQTLIKDITGVELKRLPTKTINFGLIYGMGKKTLSGALGVNMSEGEKLFSAYHRGLPFAKATMEYYSQQALDFGIITTIRGRRSYFDTFEPDDWGRRDVRAPALTYEKALQTYGPNIRRAFSHKALNRVLQGSAADLLKEAMLQCWEQGLFDETGVPRLTVHDELDFSDPGGKDKYFEEIRRVFENAIKLNVPVLVDEEVGPDWGHVK